LPDTSVSHALFAATKVYDAVNQVLVVVKQSDLTNFGVSVTQFLFFFGLRQLVASLEEGGGLNAG
jgi:hypothetical protein